VAKKSKLPFVVQPRLRSIVEVVGTEDSGQIKIERKGYLTVAEKSIVQNSLSDDDTMRQVYMTGSLIARETSRSYSDIMQDMVKQPRPDYMEEYDEKINKCLMGMLAYQERLKIIVATSLLICRVDPEWEVSSTMDLHPDLIDDLNKLYEDEDAKSIEALEQAAEEAEEKGAEVKK